MSSFFRKDLTSLFLNSLPLSDLIELSFLLLKTIFNALMTLLEVLSVMGWIHK